MATQPTCRPYYFLFGSCFSEDSMSFEDEYDAWPIGWSMSGKDILQKIASIVPKESPICGFIPPYLGFQTALSEMKSTVKTVGGSRYYRVYVHLVVIYKPIGGPIPTQFYGIFTPTRHFSFHDDHSYLHDLELCACLSSREEVIKKFRSTLGDNVGALFPYREQRAHWVGPDFVKLRINIDSCPKVALKCGLFGALPNNVDLMGKIDDHLTIS